MLATFTVTNTNDSGLGSLRDAIEQANQDAVHDNIHFAIPGAGVHTIQPLSELPTVTTPVRLDATTQPGYAGMPLIELDGTLAGADVSGLVLTDGSDGSEIHGLSIGGFSSIGIELDQVSSMWISRNHIGVDALGANATPNQLAGIRILSDSHDNTIGTNADGVGDALEGNIVSANPTGIALEGTLGESIERTRILGNVIGPGTIGDFPQLQIRGIFLRGSVSGTRIGSGTEHTGNVISGNRVGIRLEPQASRDAPTDTSIQNNLIGTTSDGEGALPNTEFGIESVTASRAPSPTGTVIGTDGDGLNDATEGNVLSGNFTGASLVGFETVIAGNLVGTNRAGTRAVPNTRDGIVLLNRGRLGTNNDGVSDALERNIISGNGRVGFSSGGLTTIAGNFIGTDVTGTRAIPNQDGVHITTGDILGGVDPAQRNVVSGNSNAGITVGGGTVIGNYVGTDVTGTLAVPNGTGIGRASTRTGNGRIGGGLAGEGNVVSGNLGAGLNLQGVDNFHIAGNFIGLDAGGEAALANGLGLVLDGINGSFVGTNGDGINDASEGNYISGNVGIGLETESSNARQSHGGAISYISGNRIGLTPSGRVIGNGSHGVVVEGSRAHSRQPLVLGVRSDGVSDDLEPNIIVGNGGNGVHIRRDNNSVLGNYIGVLPDGTPAGNSGDGLRVFDSVTTVSRSDGSFPNRIQYNGGFGIDNAGTLSGSANIVASNGLDAISGFVLNREGNQLNFPVVTSIQSVGGSTTIEGFARPGQRVTLFESGPTTGGAGEGLQVLASLAEGGADDLDTGIGSYGPEVNGITVGSDSANRFRFVIPTPVELTEGTRLATQGSTDHTLYMSGFSPSFLFGELGSSVLPDVDLGGDAVVAPGAALRRTATFTDPDSISWSGTVNFGDGTVMPLLIEDFAFDLQHEYESPGTYTVTVNLTDNSLLTTTETMLVTVENDAPDAAFYTFDLTSPVTENELVTLTGEFFDGLSSGDYDVSIDWGDGGSDTIVVDSSQRSFEATHVYLDDSNVDQAPTAADTYEVSVTISESGGSGDTTPVGVLLAEVRNAIPTDVVATFSDTVVTEGDTITLDLSFVDSGTLDTHEFLIDWGDREQQVVSVPAGQRTVTGLTHTYADDPLGPDDTYTVTIQLTDDDEPLNPVTVTQAIVVSNPAPTNIVVSNQSVGPVDENGVVTIGGSFDDPGTADQYLVSIDWGDGSGETSFSLPAGSTGFSGIQHQYLDDPAVGSEFTVTVSVADQDSPDSAGTGTLGVAIGNVAPTIGAPQLSASTIDEGDLVTVTGSFADVGSRDRHTVEITWGDGTTSPATVDGTSRTFVATHRYADDGAFTITATATDDDGDSASSSATLTVLNVAPDVAFLPAENNNDITMIELLSDVFDPGTSAGLSNDGLAFLWEAELAGSVVQTGTGPTFTLDRTGNLSEIFVVTLTVSDDESASGSYTLDVQVGTSAADVITLTNASVSAAGDGILVLGLEGEDIIDATGVTDPSISLVLDGGADQDFLFGGSGDDTYVLADGDDVANIAPGAGGLGTPITPNVAGNDRYVLSPNSTLRVFDDLGGNELDFSRAAFGVTFDLDVANSQTFASQDVAPGSDPNTHFVEVDGEFGELRGSTFGDELTAANDSTVRAGAGDDNLFVKANTINASFEAGADDDTLLVTGSGIQSLNFTGDDGLDLLNNTGAINGLTFGGGADDDLLQNGGSITGTLNFGGDDGIDTLLNTGDITSIVFGGGADDDLLQNGGSITGTLNFGGDDGVDTLLNTGDIASIVFGGGADDDLLQNDGSITTTLNFGGDDGADTLLNGGSIGSLTFGGGADDDLLQNSGSITSTLNFGGDDGIDALLNTGAIGSLTFNGGADDDLLLNNGDSVTTLNFSGDDDLLLDGAGTITSLNFTGDDGADLLVNLNQITGAITFSGGADDDLLLNNGDAVTSISFGGDDDILLDGAGSVGTINFTGDDGADSLLNAGAVTSIVFGGGADDDLLINEASSVTSIDFGGDDGSDLLLNSGSSIGSIDFTGDDGLDTLTNTGAVSQLTFGGGADDDLLRNEGSITTSLNFNGDDGNDLLLNSGSITGLTFGGGADDDLLINEGTIVGSLNFGGDDGADLLQNSGNLSSIVFGGGADDDLLLNDGSVTGQIDFDGDVGADSLLNTGSVGSIVFGGGADDDLLINSGGSISALDFTGDEGADSLINQGALTSVVFTGGADGDRFLNTTDSIATLTFHGGGSASSPLVDPTTDGDDLLVNVGANVGLIDFNGAFGDDVLQNRGASVGDIQFEGGAGNDVLLNSGNAVNRLLFVAGDGNDLAIQSGLDLVELDYDGDDGNDILVLRGTGANVSTSSVVFDGGDGIDVFHNHATGFASTLFTGGAATDVFVNEADGAAELAFDSGPGDDLFENGGNNVDTVTFTAGDGFDLAVNTGNSLARLTFDAGADSDSLVNLGSGISHLIFRGGEGDERFENRGDGAGSITFDAGEGTNLFRNLAENLTGLNFIGGSLADTLILAAEGVNPANVLFSGNGGDDRFLNAATGAMNLDFFGGIGADGFQNDGEIIDSVLFDGGVGDDIAINNGIVTAGLTVRGGDGSDDFAHLGDALADSAFDGGDGNDHFDAEGLGLTSFTFDGGNGFDEFHLSGDETGTVTFNGGSGNDAFIGISTAVDGVTVNGGAGDDVITNHSPVGTISIVGGEGHDAFTHTGDATNVSFEGGNGADTLTIRDAAIGSANLLTGSGTDAVRIAGDTISSLSLHTGAGIDSVDVASSGTSLNITTGDDADRVILRGSYANSFVDTQVGDDNILLMGSGSISVDGGIGDDTFVFVGDQLTSVNVTEQPEAGADTSSDTLDFSAFLGGGLLLDLRDTTAQSFGGMTLTLADASAIENVVGTEFADTIDGNARDNRLTGADLDEGFSGPIAPRRAATQWVHVDFDSLTDEGEHVYTLEERTAILERVNKVYRGPDTADPWFDVRFTDDVAQIPSADFVSVEVNQTPPSGRPGGLAEEIDPGNRNPGGSAIVQITGLLGGILSEVEAEPFHDHASDGESATELAPPERPGTLKPAGSSDHYVRLTAKIVAHEVGHLLGLRHQDAFGPIGFGVGVVPGPGSYNPEYPGPAGAFETLAHIGGSPATVGSTRFDDLNDLFFGEREAIKLSAAVTDPDYIFVDESAVSHSSFETAQSLQPAVISVPNTLTSGINANDTFSVQYLSLRGEIEIDENTDGSENDFYTFEGSAGDVVTVELLSNSIAAFGSTPDDFVDSILRVYDADRNLVPHFGGFAENDDIFEPTDSAVFDLTLPVDGTYFVEVDTFRRDPNDPLGDPTNPNSPLNPANPNNILDHPELVERFLDGLNDTDTGKYELIMYSLRDASATDGINILRGNGGTDTIVGGSLEDHTAPISQVDALPDTANSLSFEVSVSGSDPDDGSGAEVSGVKEYQVLVAVDDGDFELWQTLPADVPSATFNAESNHIYWFKSIAIDTAGNVEADAGTSDTRTAVGDFSPPDTSVVSATADDSGIFTLTASGQDLGGGVVARFDFYVAVDDGEFDLIGSAYPSGDGSGTTTVSLNYQGIVDGTQHTYRFYSVGIDAAGNAEAAPSSADQTAAATFSRPFEATGIDVQRGANQRSYIRYLQVGFNDDDTATLQALIDEDRLRLERFNLNAPSAEVGTGDVVSHGIPTVAGNAIEFDFGVGGIGGNARSAAGNGLYRISIDTNGNDAFDDQHFEFARVFGDATGDEQVSSADVARVASQFGRRGSNLDGDITGDGVVNILDRLFAMRNMGTKLNDDLLPWLDD